MSRQDEDARLLADYSKATEDARAIMNDRNASELARLQARDKVDYTSEYAAEIVAQNGWW